MSVIQDNSLEIKLKSIAKAYLESSCGLGFFSSYFYTHISNQKKPQTLNVQYFNTIILTCNGQLVKIKE